MCVLMEKRLNIVTATGPVGMLKWYPIREAAQEEAAVLAGQPLREIDPAAGLYVDEDGEHIGSNTEPKPNRSRWR